MSTNSTLAQLKLNYEGDNSPVKRKATEIDKGKDSSKKAKTDDDDKRKRKGSPDHKERKKEKKSKRKEEKLKQKQLKQAKKETVEASFYEEEIGNPFWMTADYIIFIALSEANYSDAGPDDLIKTRSTGIYWHARTNALILSVGLQKS